MFIILFAVSFVIALALSMTVAWISREAIDSVLGRFVTDHIVRTGFEKYIRLAIVVVGISGGTRVRALEEYISAPVWTKPTMEASLTQEFWVMELYRTVLGTLEGIVGLLLLCIFLALIAPIIVRKFKTETPKTVGQEKPLDPGRTVANPR